ncbi:hypothetical protein STENM223S_09507 [Streptomyces tendae]
MYPAAAAASPFSQAAKNFSVVSATSSALGGPLRGSDAEAPGVPSSADTRLYAPYPAPPTITAHTPPMTATLTPLPIGSPLPVSTPARLLERVQK